MATTPIEIPKLPAGLTLTCDVYPRGSDTADQTAITLTEATNRKGTYAGNVTAASTGLVTLKIKSGAAVIAEVTAYIEDDTSTWIMEDAASLMKGEAGGVTVPATIGTSTLTQDQVTGGAYAINHSSFAFNSALDFTTTQKAATLARVTLTDNVATLAGAATVVLTDASLTTAKLGTFALAKGTNITGFNDITAAQVEAAILDEGDATALLAAIAAKVEEFLVNEGDATATIAAIATACNSAIIAGTVGSNVSAIKAKTDNLPASPAAVGSAMTLTSAYDPAKTASQAGDAMTLTSAYDAAKTAASQSSVNAIPTNPMLATEDGTSFTAIPDMATATNQAAIAGYIDTEVAAILTGLTSGIVVLHADYNAAKTAASQTTANSDHDTTQAAIAALAFATSTDVTNAQAAIIAEINANEAKIDTGNAVLAKIDTGLEADGSGGYQGTALFLENGPSGSGLDAAGVRSAIGLASANLDTQLGAIPTATAVAMFTTDTGETYASSVAGSVVKEIADNAGVGAIENTVIVSSQAVLAQAVNNSGILTIVTHSVFSVQITGLGDISDRTDLLFTIKASIGLLQNNSDKEAVIQISENGGLLRYNATAASDSSLATLVVDDEDAGDVTIWIHESICSLLVPAEKRPYSFKKVKTGGNDQELTSVDYDNGATTYARILSGVAKTVS